MRSRVSARVLAGSVLLPALLLLNLVACGVKPQQVNEGEVKRAGDYRVSMNVQPNPPRSGRTAKFTFRVSKGGKPVDTSRITPRLTFDMPKMAMNLPEAPLKAGGDGRWSTRVKFSMAGGWAATLALPDGGEKKVTFKFDVAP